MGIGIALPPESSGFHSSLRYLALSSFFVFSIKEFFALLLGLPLCMYFAQLFNVFGYRKLYVRPVCYIQSMIYSTFVHIL